MRLSVSLAVGLHDCEPVSFCISVTLYMCVFATICLFLRLCVHVLFCVFHSKASLTITTNSITVYCLIKESPILPFLLYLPKALSFHSTVISSLNGENLIYALRGVTWTQEDERLEADELQSSRGARNHFFVACSRPPAPCTLYSLQWPIFWYAILLLQADA